MKIPFIGLAGRDKNHTDSCQCQPNLISSNEWNRELISRYDNAGPRYTSYPTALQFNEEFTLETYRQEAKQNLQDSLAPLSLYIRIPFCDKLCYCCAGNKIVTADKRVVRTYMDYLIKEIAIQSQLIARHRTVTQLHFGGGTPTYLDGAELTELMHQLATHYRLADSNQREYSIKVDPRTVNSDKLALLKGLGFNRLSLGVQDFDKQVQKAINRRQDVDMITSLTENANMYGFKSVSYDLIYGLPKQSLCTLKYTLDETISLSPDSISLCNYAQLAERFDSQRAIGRHDLPSAQQKLDMLMLIGESLLDAGYRHIGMDHFVKPDDDLAVAQQEGRLQRNLQGYSASRAKDLIGLGLSSISSLENCYAQNERDLQHYYHRLDKGQLPIYRGISLTKDDKLRGGIIEALICHLRVNFLLLEKPFSISYPEYFSREIQALKSMERDGLVYWRDAILHVTERGRTVLKHICMVFDKYLHPAGAGVNFSKVL